MLVQCFKQWECIILWHGHHWWFRKHVGLVRVCPDREGPPGQGPVRWSWSCMGWWTRV